MTLEADMRAQRKVETAQEREERLKREAQRKSDDSAASDSAVDERIKRNVEQYGP